MKKWLYLLYCKLYNMLGVMFWTPTQYLFMIVVICNLELFMFFFMMKKKDMFVEWSDLMMGSPCVTYLSWHLYIESSMSVLSSIFFTTCWILFFCFLCASYTDDSTRMAKTMQNMMKKQKKEEKEKEKEKKRKQRSKWW